MHDSLNEARREKADKFDSVEVGWIEPPGEKVERRAENYSDFDERRWALLHLTEAKQPQTGHEQHQQER